MSATLQRFISWIPMGYIFETSLLTGLVDKFLINSAFRCVRMMSMVCI